MYFSCITLDRQTGSRQEQTPGNLIALRWARMGAHQPCPTTPALPTSPSARSRPPAITVPWNIVQGLLLGTPYHPSPALFASLLASLEPPAEGIHGDKFCETYPPFTIGRPITIETDALCVVQCLLCGRFPCLPSRPYDGQSGRSSIC